MEPTGYLSKPLKLSHGIHFESSNVLKFMITTLDQAVARQETENSIDLLTTIFKLIRPHDPPHVEKISKDDLVDLFRLAAKVLKQPRCSASKIPDLNQVCFSQMVLSMCLTESPKQLADHPAYHGKVIRQMILKITADQEGILFDVAGFIEKYTQYIFKTTPKHDGKLFLIRDSLSNNPKFKLKSIEHRFVMSILSNNTILSTRIRRKEESGIETWTHLRKDNFGRDISFSTFRDLHRALEKSGPFIPARRLKEAELERYIHLSTIRYQLMDPLLKECFNDPVIDNKGNTYSSCTMRGNLRSADSQEAHHYRSNHLVTSLVKALKEEMHSIDETFGKVMNLLTNSTTDLLFIEPVVAPDGHTYEKGQVPEKDSIPNKKIGKILEILKR